MLACLLDEVAARWLYAWAASRESRVACLLDDFAASWLYAWGPSREVGVPKT